MSIITSPEKMSKRTILKEASEVLSKFIGRVGIENFRANGIKLDNVYNEVIYPSYEIELVQEKYLGFDEYGLPILGQYLPFENVALIDKKLYDKNDPRRVFTAYHEISHGILHGDYLRKTESKCQVINTTPGNLDRNTLEKQASFLAANLAAPVPYIRYLFKKLFEAKQAINYCGARSYNLYFMHRDIVVEIHSPYEIAHEIAKRIQPYFGGLSVQCLTIQVLHARIINYKGYNVCKYDMCDSTSNSVADEDSLTLTR